MGYIILTIAAMAIVEFALSSTWNSFYFSHGICVIKKKYQLRIGINRLPNTTRSFGSKKWFKFKPTIVLHRLKNGQYGIREKIFDSSLLGYSSVIRGNIMYNRENGELTIRYLINWYYLLFFLGIFLGLSLSEIEQGRALSNSILPFFLLSMLILFLTTAIVLIQLKLYTKPIKLTFLNDFSDTA